jgi:hypothetical protein
MAKPYKLSLIELNLSPIKHFEDNLCKFINDENIANDKKKYFCFKTHFDK